MSIQLHAAKTQISMSVSNALTAIKNRSIDVQWAEKVKSSADQLIRLRKGLNTSKNNVQHFGGIQAKTAGRRHGFAVRQSTMSRTANMGTLEKAANDAMITIGKQLQKEAKKSPFEDKSAFELVDMLAGEVASYDQLLSKLDTLAKTMSQANSNTHATIVRHETSLLKSQGVSNGPSALMMVALLLRMAAMMLTTRK